MSQYVNVKLHISESQRKKLKTALGNNANTVSIQLDSRNLNGSDVLALTKRQVNKLAKAFENGKAVRITMSPAQLKHNLSIEGGFLGMLAGLAARALPLAARALPFLGKQLGIGALSGLAHTGVQKLMGKGLYLKKGGCVCRVETDGRGLYLDPVSGEQLKLYGDGLYLNQGGKIMDGTGLLLGPNSPFRHIPILGAIL